MAGMVEICRFSRNRMAAAPAMRIGFAKGGCERDMRSRALPASIAGQTSTPAWAEGINLYR